MTKEPVRHPPAPGRARRTLALAALVLAVLALLAWWRYAVEAGFGDDYTIAGAMTQIRAWGSWAALGSIVLMVVHSFLPFPSEIIALANGMIFGPFWGSVISWSGAMLGAVSTYALVRFFGQPLVHRLLDAEQERQLHAWSAERGALALLVARLIPLIAFNLINYGAALAGVRWWTFVWTTGLGILPMTLLLNVFGDRILSMDAWHWLAAAFLLLAVTLLAKVALRRTGKPGGAG